MNADQSPASSKKTRGSNPLRPQPSLRRACAEAVSASKAGSRKTRKKLARRTAAWALAGLPALAGLVLWPTLGIGDTVVSIIGVNFTGRDDPNDYMGSTVSAGVLAQTDWNNDTVQVGGALTNTSQTLYNSSGVSTASTVTLTANDSWASGGIAPSLLGPLDSTGNGTLLNGIIKEGNPNGTGGNFVFNNVAAAGPGSAWSYNVIAYTMMDQAGGDFSLALGSTTYYGEAQIAADYLANPVFVQATATSLPATFAEVNYVEFNNVQAAGGAITLTYTHLSGANGVGMAGLQLIDVFTDPNNQALEWTGASNGVWDTATSNWQIPGTGPAAYSNNVNGTGVGNEVVFDDTATGTHNIVIANSGAGVMPDNILVDTATSYAFSGEAITGPANLTINGSGTTGAVALNSANTFTGLTTLNAGTLTLGNANALQGSTFVTPVATGTDSGLVFASGIGAFTLGGLSGTGDVNLMDSSSAPVNLKVGANNTTTTYNGSLTGGGGLTKIGNATLNLTSAQALTGAVAVDGGTLALNGAGATISAASGVTLMANGKSAPPTLFGDPVPAPVLFLNDGSGADTNHFGNVPVTLNGGTIAYLGGASATPGNVSTTITNVTVNTSGFFTAQPNIVNQGGTGNVGGDLGITNLTVNPAATVTFESQYSPLGNGSGNSGQVHITNLNGAPIANTNGIIGGWATVMSFNNGGTGDNNGQTGLTDFAAYGSDGVTAVAYNTETNGTITGALATDNINEPGGDTVATSTIINSLNDSNITAQGNLTLNAGVTLTLNSGGLIMGGNNHIITGGGQLTAGPGSQVNGAGNYNLFVTVNETSFNGGGTDLEINGVTITDNGVPVNLIKGGVGALVLNAANTFTGMAIINAGTLILNAGGQTTSALADVSAIVVNSGGTLEVNVTDGLGYYNNNEGSITINEGGVLTVTNGNRASMDRNLTVIGGTVTSGTGGFNDNSSYSFRDFSGGPDPAGGTNIFMSAPDGTPATLSAVDAGLDGTTTFDVVKGGGPVDLVLSGSLADSLGTGSFTLTGNGVTVISNVNTYSGSTAINGGTVIAAGNVPSGSAGIFGNSTTPIALGYDAAHANGSNPTLLIGGAFTIARAITIQNQPVNGGIGNYVLGNSTNNNATFSGAITMGQSLTITAASTGANFLNFTGEISSSGGAQTLTIAGPGNLNLGVLGVAGTGLSDGSGTLSLTVNGGTTNLNGPSGFSGATTLNGGTLILKTTNSVTTGVLTVNTGATLDLFGNTAAYGNFSGSGGTITNNGPTPALFTVANDAAQIYNFAGAITDGAKPTAFAYAGTGTLQLAGNNTYSGTTAVELGTLALAAPASHNNIPNSPTISVLSTLDVTGLSGGGLTLGANQNVNGFGAILGAIITQNGSQISPGQGSSAVGGNIGTLSIGSLTLTSGAILNDFLGTPGNPGTNTSIISVSGNLSLPSSGVNVNFLGSLANGTYELIGYGTDSGFASTTFTSSTVGKKFTFVDNTAGDQIDVTVASSGLIFAGNGTTSAPWDVTTTDFASGSTASAFANGSAVTFQDINPLTGSNVTSTNVVIQTAGVSPSGILFSNNSVNYTFSNGPINGGAAISMNGTGTVTFTESNNFTGAVTIGQGALNIQNVGGLGNSSGVIVASGAALQLQGGITTNHNVPLLLNGTGLAANPQGALENVAGANTYTGPITLNSNSSIGVDGAGDTLSLTNAIGGGGQLNIVGSGTVNLSGANNYTGGTLISSGTLNAVANSTGTFGPLSGSIVDNSNLQFTVNGGAVSTLNPTTLITGSGATMVTTASGGTLALSFTNQLSANGTLTVQSGSATATLDLHGWNQTVSGLNGNGEITSNSGSAGSPTLTILGSGTFSGVIDNTGSDVVNVVLAGGGAETLSGANTFSGNTTLSNATLILNNQNALENSNLVLSNGAGAVQFNSGIGSFRVGALSGSTNLPLADASGAPVALTVGNASGSYSGVLQDSGQGPSSLIVNGPGTQTLTGVNTYSGNTTVLAGTLQLSGSGQINGVGGNISVGGGTGTGTLALAALNTFVSSSDAPTSGFSNASLTFTLNAGGQISSASFNQLPNVVFNGGSLVATNGLNSSFGTFGLQGTVTAGTTGVPSTASSIYETNANPFNFIDLGIQNTNGPTTFNVASTGSAGADLTVAIPINDNGNQVTGNTVNGLIKTGPGSLAIVGGGWYSGGTDIQQGTLIGGGTLGKGTVTVEAGASLVVGSSGVSVPGVGLLGGGLASQYINTANTPGNNGGLVNANLFLTLPALQNLFATQPITTGRTEPTLNLGLVTGNFAPIYYNNGSVNFGFLASGILDIVNGGTYTFGTNSDDGSVIYIDGQLVVSNANYQGVSTTAAFQQTGSITLAPGQHTIVEGYFQGTGGYLLYTGVSGPDTGNVVQDLSGANIGLTPDLIVQSLNGSGNIVLNTGNLIVGGDNSSTEFDGAISGVDGIQKVGSGTLILGGNNTYGSGNLYVNTTITSGTLQIGNGGTTGALGAGNVINNATLVFDRSDTTPVVVPNTISGTGSVNLIGTGIISYTGANTYSGGTTISSGTLEIGNGGSLPPGGSVTNNGNLVFNSSGTSTIAGQISGAGTLIQQGTGTVTLSGNNVMTGPVVVSQGTLGVLPIAFSDGALTTPLGTSTVTLSGGTLALKGAQATVPGIAGGYYNIGTLPTDTTNGDPDFNSLAALNARYGGLTPTQAVTSTSIGGQTFTTFNLGTTFLDLYGNQQVAVIFNGEFNAPVSAGTSAYTFSTNSDDGSLLFIDGQMVVNNNFLQGPTTRSGTITLSPGLHNIEIAYYQSGGGYALSAQVQNPNLNGGATQDIPDSAASTDPGLLSLTPSASQTYANGVTVTANSDIDVSGSLSATIGPLAINGSTLSITSADTSGSPYSLTTGATTLSGNATFNVNSSATAGAATLSLGPVSDSGTGDGLTKTGNGTLILTGANTYTGPTTITSGTVIVGAAGSISGSVAVAHGATFDVSNLPGTFQIPSGHALSATGTDSGFATVNGSIEAVSGATVAPGVAGQLLVTGTALFDAGSGFSVSLSKSPAEAGSQPTLTDYGQLSVTGAVSITTGSGLFVNVGSGIQQGDIFTIMLTGGESGHFSGETPIAGTSTYLFSSEGQAFEINYAYDGTQISALSQFQTITDGTEVALLAVPEPGSAASLMGGLGMLLGLRRFRRRS